jgi:nitrite reductase/ring-hydroxylating ferredoxin subunit
MSNAAAAEKYVEVAKTNEIANRQMKHIEVKGKEILIANIDGKFYALNDRCGHMNALLSMGNLSNDNIVTCPFHGARFDITTGKKVKRACSNTFARNGTTTKNMAKVFGICRTINGSY